MNRLTPEARDLLLRELAQMGSVGRAEWESDATFTRTFYPVPEHARAFDPDVVLIVGDRGAGKSELFRAVVQKRLLPAIARRAPGVRLPPLEANRARWLAGYPLHADGFDASGLRHFLQNHSDDRDAATDVWFAYLVRVLQDKLDLTPSQSLETLCQRQGGAIEEIYSDFRTVRKEALLAVDALDESLQEADGWVFVSYDELDTVAGYDWPAMGAAIRGLVSFWASYARRWRRLRAKIFLRTDLFRRHTEILGADISKLAGNRAELSWSDRNLYSMLVKRIANTSDSLREYCLRSRVEFEEDKTLGFIPIVRKAEDVRPLIERLAGVYMGANIKKGLTFRWLLDHVRDGRGKAVPRALVRLLEEAAAQELENPRAAHQCLLLPTSLRRALDKVSQEHVLQANTHELPWLPGVAHRVKGQEVPWGRREVEWCLGRSWDQTWDKQEDVRPPEDNPRDLVDYLIELGVLRARSDGRIDVPDLFLAGLGLKRKGGVKRR